MGWRGEEVRLVAEEAGVGSGLRQAARVSVSGSAQRLAQEGPACQDRGGVFAGAVPDDTEVVPPGFFCGAGVGEVAGVTADTTKFAREGIRSKGVFEGRGKKGEKRKL
jgi:hypothetical protein